MESNPLHASSNASPRGSVTNARFQDRISEASLGPQQHRELNPRCAQCKSRYLDVLGGVHAQSGQGRGGERGGDG